MLPCSAVALYNLGIPDSANAAASSIAGTIMLGNARDCITYQVQAPVPFHLDFKDPNQVVLKAGHQYVFELQGECNAVSIFWRRNRSDVHLSGATYRNRQLMGYTIFCVKCKTNSSICWWCPNRKSVQANCANKQ